ncbi:unnamed protein product [Rhodiola kirilowii]
MLILAEDAELTPILRSSAGVIAGIIGMSATYPMYLARGRLTIQVLSQPDCWCTSKFIISFQIPNAGVNFGMYESLKAWLIKTRPFGLVEDTELSVPTRLACGAVAGTFGQTVAYPFNVFWRRMQMVGWKGAASFITGGSRHMSAGKYNGMVDAIRKTVRNEGFGALFKGVFPNSVKVVLSIATSFVTYEMVKDVLGVEI